MRSTWAMANPVGTGPYLLKEWRRGQKIVLEANPGFREVRYPESSDPADKAIMAKLKGKRIPLIGRVEISIIEEGNPRLLSFEQQRARLRRRAGRPRLERARSAGDAEAAARAAGHPARARRPAGDHLHLLQHGGSGRRRLHAGEDRAAPRGEHGLQRARGDQGHPPGAGDAGEPGRAADGQRPQPEAADARDLRSRRRDARCSTASATRIATTTASASCPTASR